MLDFIGRNWDDLSAEEQISELDNQWRDVRQAWDRGEMMPDELLLSAGLFKEQLLPLAENSDAESLLDNVSEQVREAEELNDVGLLIRGDGILLRPGDSVDINQSLSIIYEGEFYTAGEFARLAAQGEFDIEVLIDVTEGEIHVKYGRLEYELRGTVAIKEFTVDNDGGDGVNDLVVLIEGRLIPDTHIDNPIVEQMTIMWKGEEVNPYDLAQGLVERSIYVDIDPQRDQVTIIYDGGEYVLRGQGVVRKFAVDNIDFAGGPELYIVTYEDNFLSAGEDEDDYDRRDGVEAGDGDRISLVYDSDLVTFDFLVDEGIDISVDPRAEIVTVKYAGATYTLRGKGAVERFYKDAEDVRGGVADDLVFYVDDAKLQGGDSERPRDALEVYYKGKELTLEQLAEAEGVTVAIDLDRAEVKVHYEDWSYTLTGDFVVELFGGVLDPAKGEIDALIIEVASLYEEWQETEKQWDRSKLTPQDLLDKATANENRLNEIEATIAADYADQDTWTAPLEEWIDDLRKDMKGEVEEANAALSADEGEGEPESGPTVDDLIADVRRLTDNWSEIEVQWDSGKLTAAQLLEQAKIFESTLSGIEAGAPDNSTLEGMISYLRTDMEGEVEEAFQAQVDQEAGGGNPDNTGSDTLVVMADGQEVVDLWGKKIAISDTVSFWLGGSQISTVDLIAFADKVKIDEKKNKVKIEIDGEKFELRGSAAVETFTSAPEPQLTGMQPGVIEPTQYQVDQEAGGGNPDNTGSDTLVVMADGQEVVDLWGKKIAISDTVSFWLGGSQISTVDLIAFADKVKIDENKNKVKIEIDGEKFELKGDTIVDLFLNPTTNTLSGLTRILNNEHHLPPEDEMYGALGGQQSSPGIGDAIEDGASATITFQAWELGTWDGAREESAPDELWMTVNGVTFSLGQFDHRIQEGGGLTQGDDIRFQPGQTLPDGISGDDISITSSTTGNISINGPHASRGQDQIHTFTIEVSANLLALKNSANNDGEDIRFSANMGQGTTNGLYDETYAITDFNMVSNGDALEVMDPVDPVDPDQNELFIEQVRSYIDGRSAVLDSFGDVEDNFKSKNIATLIADAATKWNVSEQIIAKVIVNEKWLLDLNTLLEFSDIEDTDMYNILTQVTSEANLISDLRDELDRFEMPGSSSPHISIIETLFYQSQEQFVRTNTLLREEYSYLEKETLATNSQYQLGAEYVNYSDAIKEPSESSSTFSYNPSLLANGIKELRFAPLGLDDLESLNNFTSVNVSTMRSASNYVSAQLSSEATNKGLEISERLQFLADVGLNDLFVGMNSVFEGYSELGDNGDLLLQSLKRDIGEVTPDNDAPGVGSIFGTVFYMIGGAVYSFGGAQGLVKPALDGVVSATGAYAYLGGALGHSSTLIGNLLSSSSPSDPPRYELATLDLEGFTALETFEFIYQEGIRRADDNSVFDWESKTIEHIEKSESAANGITEFVGKAGLVEALSKMTMLRFNQGSEGKDYDKSNRLVDRVQDKTNELDNFFEGMEGDEFDFNVRWDAAYSKSIHKDKNVEWVGRASEEIEDHDINSLTSNLYKFQAEISGGVLGDETIQVTWLRDAENKREAREEYQEFVMDYIDIF
jgi:hypothetical protein